MHPFVVDVFKNNALASRKATNLNGYIVHNQRTIQSVDVVPHEWCRETYEWVYFDVLETKTINEWMNYGSPYTLETFNDNNLYTFSEWIAFINPKPCPQFVPIPLLPLRSVAMTENEIKNDMIKSALEYVNKSKPEPILLSVFSNAAQTTVNPPQATAVPFHKRFKQWVLTTHTPRTGLAADIRDFVDKISQVVDIAEQRLEAYNDVVKFNTQIVNQNNIITNTNAYLKNDHKQHVIKNTAIKMSVAKFFRHMLSKPLRYDYC